MADDKKKRKYEIWEEIFCVWLGFTLTATAIDDTWGLWGSVAGVALALYCGLMDFWKDFPFPPVYITHKQGKTPKTDGMIPVCTYRPSIALVNQFRPAAPYITHKHERIGKKKRRQTDKPIN